MADHGQRLAILHGQRASNHCPDAEDRIVVARYGLRERELGLAVDGSLRSRGRTKGRHSRQRRSLFVEIRGSRGGEGKDGGACLRTLPEHDEIVRVDDGKRPQQDGIDD
jgi:hypothetical protein